MCTFALAFENNVNINVIDGFQNLYRGVEQLVARQAHNLEVVRSSRASATKESKPFRFAFFVYTCLVRLRL